MKLSDIKVGDRLIWKGYCSIARQYYFCFGNSKNNIAKCSFVKCTVTNNLPTKNKYYGTMNGKTKSIVEVKLDSGENITVMAGELKKPSLVNITVDIVVSAYSKEALSLALLDISHTISAGTPSCDCSSDNYSYNYKSKEDILL